MLRSRYHAVFLCAAVGDILGKPVEGWQPQQIKRHVGRISQPLGVIAAPDEDEDGMIPHISSQSRLGQWTDNTWLLVTTAQALLASGFDLMTLAHHSAAMFAEQNHPSSGSKWGSFGKTTTTAFENLQRGVSPFQSATSHRSGNAPALKTAPIGLYMAATDTYDEGLQFAEIVGRMTHLHPSSIASGIVQAHAIYTLLQENVSPDDVIRSIVQVCNLWEKSPGSGAKVTLQERLQWVAANYATIDEEAAHRVLIKTGWPVTENYPFTLYMFLKYWDDSLDGMLRLVNFGGDCDSTAALYGALAGARNGIFVHDEWLQVLEGREELLALADQLYDLRCE